MQHTNSGIMFGPYRLAADGGRLWKDDVPVALQPRPLAVLAYLAARPGEVVSRDELLATLWAGTHVTRAVLKVAVRAIREATGDDAEAPRYVETVGRDGYRFIGTADGRPAPPAPPRRSPTTTVGRAGELDRLHASLASACDGTRAMVFVSGEAGIGKTTLLDRFVADAERRGAVRIARGQCLEQYGEGEAYLPILEALGALVRRDGDGTFAATLAQHAPTWVPHLPSVDPSPPGGGRMHGVVAATPARMVREMADALEALTRTEPLLLVLEDLQWSDRSSVDLLGRLARRREPARLMVVATVRPIDMKLRDHPLLAVQHELQASGLCDTVALESLSRDDVAAYVAARFPGASPAALRRLAARVHERTEGNGLFMTNMLNDFVATGLLARRDGRWHVEGSIDAATDRIPSGLQELLERRLRGLAAAERRALEAASVAGDEFAVAAVAAAVHADPGRIEDVCERLAAQGALLVDAGLAELPDGSISGRYRFRHALYRRALYQGMAEARRVRLHRAIGRRLEVAFGDRAGDHASELAMHFSLGRVHARALYFHEAAAAAALDRHAAHEAMAHYTAALAALQHVPADADRSRCELRLVVARATLLMAVEGYAAGATEAAFARAAALCDAAPDGPHLHPVLRGRLSFHQVRAELTQAQILGEQLLRSAAAQPGDAMLGVQAHYGAGTTLFHLGAVAEARTHLEAALARYDPSTHRQHVLVYGGYDPGVACALWLAWSQALQGELAEAAHRAGEALALARRHDDAFTLAWAYQAVSVSQQLIGDWTAAEASAVESVRLAEEHGFPHVLGMATVNLGLARVMRGEARDGVALLRDGVALVDRTGAALVRPSYLAMLAGVLAFEGDRRGALAGIDEALAELERTGERIFEAALLTQKGSLLMARDERGRATRVATDTAEACLRRALAVARTQGLRLLELRAAVGLARWCVDRRRVDDALTVLRDSHAWFAGHPATAAPEIGAARHLLAELAPAPVEPTVPSTAPAAGRAAAGRTRGVRSNR